MAIEKLPLNGDDYIIYCGQAYIRKERQRGLRGNDMPLTFEQVDNNFELLRAKINELVDKVNELDS